MGEALEVETVVLRASLELHHALHDLAAELARLKLSDVGLSLSAVDPPAIAGTGFGAP